MEKIKKFILDLNPDYYDKQTSNTSRVELIRLAEGQIFKYMLDTGPKNSVCKFFYKNGCSCNNDLDDLGECYHTDGIPSLFCKCDYYKPIEKSVSEIDELKRELQIQTEMYGILIDNYKDIISKCDPWRYDVHFWKYKCMFCNNDRESGHMESCKFIKLGGRK